MLIELGRDLFGQEALEPPNLGGLQQRQASDTIRHAHRIS
jgi:hypothetical protein